MSSPPAVNRVPPPKSTAPLTNPVTTASPAESVAMEVVPSLLTDPKRLLHRCAPSGSSLTAAMSSPPALVKTPPPKSTAPLNCAASSTFPPGSTATPTPALSPTSSPKALLQGPAGQGPRVPSQSSSEAVLQSSIAGRTSPVHGPYPL